MWHKYVKLGKTWLISTMDMKTLSLQKNLPQTQKPLAL